jgi:hypothetical protein
MIIKTVTLKKQVLCKSLNLDKFKIILETYIYSLSKLLIKKIIKN